MRSFAQPMTAPLAVAAHAPAMDEESFRLFHDRTARPLRAYLGAALRNDSLADDLLQESYLRFLAAGLPAEMTEDHRKNYLFRIATNLMRDHYRKAQAMPLGESVGREKLAGPGRMDDDVARRQDVHRIMEELKPRERELLWLAYVEQFSHREIAGMIGAKAESIRPMLARAREAMAGLLRNRMGEAK